MKTMDLPKMSTVKPPRQKPSVSDNGNCKNILAQNFKQSKPNSVWVCDFTYIRVGTRFYYLCAVLDLYARKIIAYKLSKRMDTQFAFDTLDLAVANIGQSSGIIFHSNRGAQFTSKCFRKHLEALNMIQSFSAKGHPYDNAVMECFFKYLKKEETNGRNYSFFSELQLSLFQYIYGFYNSLRPHSHNNGLSPNQAEDLYFSF